MLLGALGLSMDWTQGLGNGALPRVRIGAHGNQCHPGSSKVGELKLLTGYICS